ncbi:tetratricopeptide repeat protein [Sunxiuqinia sp. A32]|uniref:tetratricopeptide repeat protein n=1 Tax=Sunxiuqinia sp. A32 TaxID=3461496 RepID=UPI004045DB2F
MRKQTLIILFLIFTYNLDCFSQDAVDYQKLLIEAEKLGEDNEYGQLSKAMIYQNIKKYDSALICYNKAISLRESHSKADNENKIVLTFNTQMNTGSDDLFANGMIYYYTAVVCHELGKLDSAIINYKKITSVDRNFGDAYYQLALVYFDKEQYNLALEELNKAVKINPNDKLNLLNRAYANMQLDNNDSALIDIKKSLTIDPNEPYSYKMLGDIYLAKGDTINACLQWGRAKDLNLEIEEYLKCKCETIKN